MLLKQEAIIYIFVRVVYKDVKYISLKYFFVVVSIKNIDIEKFYLYYIFVLILIYLLFIFINKIDKSLISTEID